uniref:Coiled-coil domain containing 166 n=1 Tax=Latimeria chalumnae TaxID=7897 RepID=H3B5N6_LATCH
ISYELNFSRNENEFLQEEAQRTQEESQEYMTYMSKRNRRRQNAIITLSDQNQRDLEGIQKQKEEILVHYKEKKKELKTQLLEKENELARMHKETQDLDEYKMLQARQLGRIQELEKEVMSMKAEHSENLQKIKAAFVQEKTEYEKESQRQVQALAKEALKEAARCLVEHTGQVKGENRHLRQELLHLIRRSHVLRTHHLELEEQHRQLLREYEYSEDLKRLRTTRQHKVLLSFGYDTEKQEQGEAETQKQ